MFLKLYGVEQDMCMHAGGTWGAGAQETFQIWVWPFNEALAELQYHVMNYIIV